MPSIPTYIVTFNAGRSQINPTTFASHLFSCPQRAFSPPEILVLCLQEIAPIAYAFLGGSYLRPYFGKYEQAVDTASKAFDGQSYVKVAAWNVGMTAIMVFLRDDKASNVQSIQPAEVGFGLWGMGNKGATAIRMEYSIDGNNALSLTFVSAHLAAMEWACERRNQDWKCLVRGLVFESSAEKPSNTHSPVDEGMPLLSSTDNIYSPERHKMSGIYTKNSHLFLAGDLNYRTASSIPTIEEPACFPQPCEDDSFPRHYWHLLSSDQLTKEMRAGRTCHGLKEAPVEFPPTYKYSDRARKSVLTGKIQAERMDNVDGGRWEWAGHRWPSWCDRVLYLDLPSWVKGARIAVENYAALPLMATSDHRPVVCAIQIPAIAIAEQGHGEATKDDVRIKPPFAINRGWKRERQTARRREIIVGTLALLTTTWVALWTLSAVVLLAIALGTGIFWWESS